MIFSINLETICAFKLIKSFSCSISDNKAFMSYSKLIIAFLSQTEEKEQTIPLSDLFYHHIDRRRRRRNIHYLYHVTWPT